MSEPLRAISPSRCWKILTPGEPELTSLPAPQPSSFAAPTLAFVIPPPFNPLPPIADRTKICDYQLGKELGRGGFGTVYLAENRRTAEVCAIKVIEKCKMFDSKNPIRAMKEPRIIKKS
ncbi:hypothetical protein CROQUDRAFT_668406 [Cronartium quercuum f. sp. fusiforme G11]|uniref:Protein kinase domain-containing protein n=1 Tax=Cronartium quercuum f. sp. fusiforme G11 TaxID=708437 RepID=A0A9P6NWN9_9BASI|nr:hypothetical protein CROQUDRAFT_668406 [Cronartium quercuum f. sp. fusiforme G11]